MHVAQSTDQMPVGLYDLGRRGRQPITVWLRQPWPGGHSQGSGAYEEDGSRPGVRPDPPGGGDFQAPTPGRGRSPVAMVWPCPLPVDAYVAAGRQVEFARPACPACRAPMVLWSGYRRHVRAAGRCQKIFVPWLRCAPCRVSHALLPTRGPPRCRPIRRRQPYQALMLQRVVNPPVLFTPVATPLTADPPTRPTAMWPRAHMTWPGIECRSSARTSHRTSTNAKVTTLASGSYERCAHPRLER